MSDKASDPNIDFYGQAVIRDYYDTVSDYLRDIESAYIIDAITRSGKATSDLTVLDLGCGSGRTSLPLAALGLNVVALDLSHLLTSMVHAKQPDMSVICANAVQLPLADHIFDMVLFSANGLDLIAPIELRFAALREVARVLRPGGFFIYSSKVLPLIPYNLHTLSVVFYNLVRGRPPVKSGYFEEVRPKQGGKLLWYVGKRSAMQRDLKSCGMHPLRHSKINYIESAPRTAALAFLSWERYILAQVGS